MSVIMEETSHFGLGHVTGRVKRTAADRARIARVVRDSQRRYGLKARK